MSISYDNEMVKIVFAGQTNVGKSSILYRLNRVYNNIPEICPTIGAAFMRKTISKNGRTIYLDIWDTAGQERYQSLSSFYFRGCTYCVLVFDLTDSESFKNLDLWKQLCDIANQNSKFNPIYFLIGNKLDCKKRTILEDEVKKYCEVNKIAMYIETSAYTGEGINTFLDSLLEHINTNNTSHPSPYSTVRLSQPSLNSIYPCSDASCVSC